MSGQAVPSSSVLPLQVVRFWAQHALKLYSTFRTVSEALWGTLAGALAHMHQQLPPVR